MNAIDWVVLGMVIAYVAFTIRCVYFVPPKEENDLQT